MKFAEYLEQGYDCFISGKYQNINSGKVVTEEQESLLATILYTTTTYLTSVWQSITTPLRVQWAGKR